MNTCTTKAKRPVPCSDCPFHKNIEPGNLGGSPVGVYIAQLFLGMWLPCHTDPNYIDGDDNRGKNDFEKVHPCRGAALVRANAAMKPTAAMPDFEQDKQYAFSGVIEFMAHHTGMSKMMCYNIIRDNLKQWKEDQLNSTTAVVNIVDRETKQVVEQIPLQEARRRGIVK